MIDVLNGSLSWLGDMVSAAFMGLASFLLQFFPDADASVNAVIDSWGISGGDLTFNVFYLFDMGAVTVCAGLAVTIVFVVMVVAFVRWVISAVHDVMDSIPVIG